MRKRAKRWGLLLAAIFWLGLPPASLWADDVSGAAAPWDGTADTSWYNTEDDSFEIATAEQLAGLGEILRGSADIKKDDFSGKTVALTADLDLGGVQQADGTWDGQRWRPLGEGYVASFNGVFDGRGHKISNMLAQGFAKPDGYEDFAGLFARLTGEVRNLTIASGYVEAATDEGSAGGIAAILESGQIVNCINQAAVYNEVGGAGGIAGLILQDARLMGCGNQGNISSRIESAGGLVGICRRGGIIASSYNVGAVTAPRYVGGLAGKVETYQSPDVVKIVDSYNLGVVTGTSATTGYVGGLYGYMDGNAKSEVIYSYNAGPVNFAVPGAADVGLLGSNASRCFYGCLALAQDDLPAYSREMSFEPLADWELVDAATLRKAAGLLGDRFVDGGDGFPALKWQTGKAVDWNETADLQAAAFSDCTAYGCTVLMNKLLRTDNINTADLTLTAIVDGRPTELTLTSAEQVMVKRNGLYVTAVKCRFLTLGAGKNVTLQANYRGGEPILCSYTSPDTDSWLDYWESSFAGGSGTADDPYQIATPEQLARLAYIYQGADEQTGDKSYGWFALTADLDMSGRIWRGAPFLGHFDGRGHTIANLNGGPLFSVVLKKSEYRADPAEPRFSEIANLTMRDMQADYATYQSDAVPKDSMQDKKRALAALAGSAQDLNLTNCAVDGLTLSGDNGQCVFMAGLVGDLMVDSDQQVAKISGCSVRNAVIKEGQYVGGLVASLNAGNSYYGTVEFSNSSFSGSLGGYAVGGILGNSMYTKGIVIEQCYVEGDIPVSGDSSSGSTGGLIGRVNVTNDSFLGEDGVTLCRNVVLMQQMNSVKETGIAALNSDMPMLVADNKGTAEQNYVRADLLLNGQTAPPDDNGIYELTDDFAERAFWESLGYDFSAASLWRWNSQSGRPELKHEGLFYVQPEIVRQPQETTVYGNLPGYLEVQAAGGLQGYTYRWQYALDSGDWQDIPHADQARLEVNYGDGSLPAGESEAQIRCVVGDLRGAEVYSEAAPLHIISAALGAEKMREDLLGYYRRRGILAGAREAFALLAAGEDPKNLQNKLDFYAVYNNDKPRTTDYYNAMLDCYALQIDLNDYTAVDDALTENWNWFEIIKDAQNPVTGKFPYGGYNDCAVSIVTAMEIYFGGHPWGSEEPNAKLGREGAIAAIFSDVRVDADGNAYYYPNDLHKYSVLSDCAQGEFVLLACRLEDDQAWGEQAKAAKDAVLAGMIRRYNNSERALAERAEWIAGLNISDSAKANMSGSGLADNSDQVDVRALATMVSALTAAAGREKDTVRQAEYLELAEKIINEDLAVSRALDGGYSAKKGQHDAQADPEATAAVLLAVSDYLRGSAFAADFVYDVPAEIAVRQELSNISFPKSVSEDLVLRTQGYLGTTISWQSSMPEVVSASGQVNRGNQRHEVVLTATAQKYGVQSSREFNLLVRERGADDEYDVNEALNEAAAALPKDDWEVIASLQLPESQVAGVEFNWSSSDPNVIASDGTVSRPAVGSADQTVMLTLTASIGEASASRSWNILVYAQSDLSTQEGKLREGYLISRTGFLNDRTLNGYWDVFAAYAVLGDYIADPNNGFEIDLPMPDSSWYGTQYGAMVMAICAIGENPYNYRGIDWVQELNNHYGGMYAAPLYSALGMEAAGADPALYNKHSEQASIYGTGCARSVSLGIDIAGWGAVLAAEHLDNPQARQNAQWLLDYLQEERPIKSDGNFGDSNHISTGCAVMGLSALNWAGMEEADPLSDTWKNPRTGKGIIDATYDAVWGGGDGIAGYSSQLAVGYGDLYNSIQRNAKPSWLSMGVDTQKLKAQVAKAQNILADPAKYPAANVARLQSALDTVNGITPERLSARTADWGREYYDLYDAVRYINRGGNPHLGDTDLGIGSAAGIEAGGAGMAAAADEQAEESTQNASDYDESADKRESEAAAGQTDDSARDNTAEKQPEMTVFEIVKHTIKTNPLLLAAVVGALLMLIASGGYSRYRRSK